MKNKIFGKEQTLPPECPFCGLYIERPVEPAGRRMGEMPVGSCACGAVYSYDITGRNLGSAFIEALVFSCDMDWDLAWSLFPGEDYLEQLVENYDGISHLIVPGGFHEGRKVPGALYFIRMNKDIREVAGPGVERKLQKAVPLTASKALAPELPGVKRYSRADIHKFVEEYRFDELLTFAGQDKRILRDLQKLLYSADPLTRSRAAEALGKASAVVARGNPGTVSNLLQILLNSVSDTAASTWGAIDAIGEIIAGSPGLFGGYIPSLFQFLDDETARPRILRAIGRTAEKRPDLARKGLFRYLPYLKDADSETRGYAAWLAGCLGAMEAKADLERLVNDQSKIKIYKNGEFVDTTVGRLASEALCQASVQ
ncbi:methylated-DNA--protein-cysteine methyltransferase [Desulfocucumis palustris]|uniref:Methylated-DNA--protein-cysteine methyltransferase n=1 Tax=Desulfocucumis palustris TaxID=1898651 RepID=A0A2L2XHT8_9FIRM|nr:DVU0298 family protein [Desulfocucumis palustris]GBF35692.1 methylated-DNA--protein-cysteine methyltransferase [Desulfocucumis palustris]